ncbi:Aste57867_18932 [Aphanomyces stellatus]|uniref:Aste57867_18932 protein n=1 Tax=Aphanomyces stellatus TaxID=120398 RepID=A0A485LBB7_9STRA|nr:hypothetical protein As57867_018868 [Aphanomyces stellatus]VFT95663.1 Aste57867_18932 [Aphanomyces stellatus]
MWVLEVESESMSLHLVQGEWTLGRKGNVLNFPKDSSISRNHAEFHVGGLQDLENVNELPSFHLIDKKSRFGTYLNDVQIVANTPMLLRSGDKITFGAKSTVLRVRYFKLVARTTRIHKANRKKLLDGCKVIGMHVVTAPLEDVNYCITDPGKFVATEKVLWALVHNHPIVSSDWVQAIFRRKSMADELPHCEDFVPKQEGMTEESTPSYGADPRRFSLYSKFFVVFLAPSSMEPLIPVMGGEVFAAYRISDDQDVVEKLRKSSRIVLVIYPSTSPDAGQQSEKQSMSKAQSSYPPSREVDPSVPRRLQKLQAMLFTMVLHQELAASIIFTRNPQYLSEDSVSQLLGAAPPSRQHSIEEEDESSIHHHLPPTASTVNYVRSDPVKEMPPAEKPTLERSDDDRGFRAAKPKSALSSGRDFGSSVTLADTLPTTAASDTVEETNYTLPVREVDTTSDVVVVDRSHFSPTVTTAAVDVSEEYHVESSAVNVSTESVDRPSPTLGLEITPSQWMTKPRKRLVAANTDEDKPIGAEIVTSQLVVRRTLFDEEAPEVRYLPRHNEPTRAHAGLKNAKKFKKNHVVTSRRLITHYSNVVPVNMERQREYDKHREQLEEQERFAEELFESNMPGTQAKKAPIRRR